jgi:hypothetical protein
MQNVQQLNRLQQQLVHLIALEEAIEQKLEELLPAVSDNAEVTTLLSGFLSLPRDQRKALEMRLLALTDTDPRSEDAATVFVAGGLSDVEEYPVSSALQLAHTMFNQAVIGYSMLVPLGTRFRDSPWLADEGTSFHLANQHMGNYTRAIQEITHLLHDVLLSELNEEGYECQCGCSSCSAGVCLCSIAGRLYLSRAWEAAGPILENGPIYIQLPKQGSSAAKAGLQLGDLILSGDSREIDSIDDWFEVIDEVGPGEIVKLNVSRKSGELIDLVKLHL